MFTGLLFLIFVMLLLTFSAEGAGADWIASPDAALMGGALLYAATIGLILWQRGLFPRRQQLLEILTQSELLLFLSIAHLGLGSQRALPGGAFGGALLSLFLYFFALRLFWRRTRSKPFADRQLRFYLPLLLPFLMLTALFQIAPNSWFPLFLIGALALFFPPFIQWAWQCRPLEEGPLKESLEALCKKACFRHGGMRTWTVLGNSLTAGIIGILPRFRYVMFTERLLRELPDTSIRAILAHEIGHSQRRHLLLLPLVLIGMLFAAALIVPLFSDSLPDSGLALFLCYALLFALYFRFIFGFYSRLFEREADLHSLTLGIPAEEMTDALHRISFASGVPPERPCWHHYSIRRRIAFIEKAARQPRIIASHRRKVKFWSLLYLAALAVSIGVIYGN